MINRLKERLGGQPLSGPLQATWHGTVIAQSARTVAVEGNRYFPAADVRPEHLQPSDRQTVCPWKGTASYYDVVVDEERNAGAAWYYSSPKPAASEIAGHVAFRHGIKVGPVPAE